jgi:hypothetical protein
MTEEKKESLFLVSITGRNINFEVPINSLDDFRNLDDILKKLKKKI